MASKPFLISFSLVLYFLIIVLTVLTHDSASPFERGYLGEEVVCLNSHSLEKLLKALEVYWDPLSDTSSDGIPCREKVSFRISITCADPVLFSLYSSG